MAALTRVEGSTLLSDSDGATAHKKVEGEMDGLIKALAAFPATDLKTERPSLEDIFLACYASNDRHLLTLVEEQLPVLNGDSRIERSQKDQVVSEQVLGAR